MTSLAMNLVNRVDRLPKPTRASEALQPLFEAVSNAIHSTQSKFKDEVGKSGRIFVDVETDRSKSDVRVTVADNGTGLDQCNFDAFVTTDTDNKVAIGGKGVGRLLWLDCFENITIESIFKDGKGLQKRSFRFRLSSDEQITDHKIGPIHSKDVTTGMNVSFSGLRGNGYLESFPGRSTYVFQHLMSHFLPTFIGGNSPNVVVTCGGETREFPEAINDIIHRQNSVESNTKEYGNLRFALMECDKTASSDLKGRHFIHFIAHDRTVHSQCVDGKLGLKYFGEGNDLVFHGCIFGQFLNENVNQERTRFMFEDATIEQIVSDICMPFIEEFLTEPLKTLKTQQANVVEEIVGTYPSVKFGSTEELQSYVPSGELAEDAIYGHLSRQRFRRDQKQAEKIRHALQHLKDGGVDSDAMTVAIEEASKAIEDAEQRSLAEYIVRRKVVLDFLALLLEKVRNDVADSAYQRENVLHSLGTIRLTYHDTACR